MNRLSRSKLFNRCFSIALAMLLCMALAVPASAIDQTYDYPVSFYSYSNTINPAPNSRPIGSSFSATGTVLKGFGPMIEFQHYANTSYVVVVTINMSSAINSLLFSNDFIMAQLNSGIASSIQFPGNLYDYSTLECIREQNSTTYIITYNTSNLPYADTYDRLYFAWQPAMSTNSSTFRIEIASATAYAIYDPPGTTLDDIQIEIQNLINTNTNNNISLQNKIEQLIQSQNSSFGGIENKLEDIKDNQSITNNNLTDIKNNQVIEQSYWTQVINYGSNYDQISSTLINNLGSAEDQLSSAEDALENKSSSLKNSVSSQWQQSTQTARSFVNTISPATAAITNTVTSVVTAMPVEVQTLLTVLPLLLFIGWLIGRVGGG